VSNTLSHAESPGTWPLHLTRTAPAGLYWAGLADSKNFFFVNYIVRFISARRDGGRVRRDVDERYGSHSADSELAARANVGS
jgi:hypothetical protein